MESEIEELNVLNVELEQEIQSLLKTNKRNIRLQMFPEFFPKEQKYVINEVHYLSLKFSF